MTARAPQISLASVDGAESTTAALAAHLSADLEPLLSEEPYLVGHRRLRRAVIVAGRALPRYLERGRVEAPLRASQLEAALAIGVEIDLADREVSRLGELAPDRATQLGERARRRSDREQEQRPATKQQELVAAEAPDPRLP